jgi:hypothetical protein
MQQLNEKHYCLGTVSKSNRKIIERGKIDNIKHKYFTPHFPGLVQALQLKGTKPPLFVK